MEKSQYRLDVLKKIEEFEKKGIFDQDVEDDPETLPLLPNKIDYLQKKLISKILTAITLKKGGEFFEAQEASGNLIIKDIIGTENLLNVTSGAIVTCNHFHPFDNYIILKALRPCLKKGRYFKVIREGNYTNPPKGFEMFMRHGDTLPLSSNRDTMRKFLDSLKVLLQDRHEKVLVYPEQSLWWNYRKPKPLKNGAFNFAVSNNVPVLPLFVTMEDTENIGDDGFPIQAYTVFILPPIYPNSELSKAQNISLMKETNYKLWVKVYEEFYKIPLKYTCDEK